MAEKFEVEYWEEKGLKFVKVQDEVYVAVDDVLEKLNEMKITLDK